LEVKWILLVEVDQGALRIAVLASFKPSPDPAATCMDREAQAKGLLLQ